MYGKSQNEEPHRPRREGRLPETENWLPEEICSGEKVRVLFISYISNSFRLTNPLPKTTCQ